MKFGEFQALDGIKLEAGISPAARSCHTAISTDGYVFEGHIPSRYIRQFLAAPPEGARGLVVPGMPVGSPGMEMGDRFDPYDILAGLQLVLLDVTVYLG